MHRRKTILVLAGLSAAMGDAPTIATPPPPIGKPGDCAAPIYASDRLVCADPGLLAADRALAALLPPRTAPGVAIEDQGAWFRRSRLCAMRPDHAGCLRAAYRERIAVLTAARGFDPATAPWAANRCAPARAELAELPGGVVAVRRDRGGPVTLALAGADPALWTPFAWAATSGVRYTIRWLDGAALKCRVVHRR